MGTMTIGTLDILPLHVMALFTGMAGRTDVSAVIASTGIGTSPICSQQISVTAAQVGKICAAINGAAAGIGEMSTVARRAEHRALSGRNSRKKIRRGVCRIQIKWFGIKTVRICSIFFRVAYIDRVAALSMGLNIAGTVTVHAQLIFIILDPQETSVAIVMLVVAPDARKLVYGTAPQSVGGHLPLNGSLRACLRVDVSPIPPMRGLVHF